MNGLRMDLYLGKTTFTAMCVVLLCGSLLMLVFTLLDAVSYASESGGFAEALSKTFRTLPRKVEELAPFAIFLGVLIGVGNLSTHSEIVVLRSAGVSIARLFVSVCVPSVLMIVFAQLLIPIGLAADERDASAQGSGISSAWVREGSLFTRIGSMNNDGSLSEITQFEFAQPTELVSVRDAASASVKADTGWKLYDVETIRLTDQRIDHTTSQTASWNTPRTPQSLMTAFTTDPRKMSILELSQQIDDVRATGQDPKEFQVEFWIKLTKPLSVLGLVLIAIGFVVGSTREMGMGARLTFGIAVGFMFHYIQTLVAPMTIVFDLQPAVFITIPIVVVWIIAILQLRRIG